MTPDARDLALLMEKLSDLEEHTSGNPQLSVEQYDACARLFRALLVIAEKQSLAEPYKGRALDAGKAAAKAVPERMRSKSGEYVAELFLVAEDTLGVRF